MLRCGKLAGPDEHDHRRLRGPGRRRGSAAPARNSVQLHVVLRPRDRDPPAGRGHVAAAVRTARGAPHRALGADAVRSAGRHLGRRPQSVSAGRPARQSEAAGAAGRCHAASAARDRKAGRHRRWRGPRARRQGRETDRGGQRRGGSLCHIVRRNGGVAQAHAPRSRKAHGQEQHRIRRAGARFARDRRHRLARRVSVRRALPRHRRGSTRSGRGLHRARR